MGDVVGPGGTFGRVKALSDGAHEPGVPVYPDHEYEMFSVYQETNDAEQGATPFLYRHPLHDAQAEQSLAALCAQIGAGV